MYDLGITNIDYLKKNLDKLSHAQKIGLRHFEDFEKRIPRGEIDEIIDKVGKSVDALDSNYKLIVCGSYRRGAESSGDIDILLTHPHYQTSAKKHADFLHRRVFLNIL